MGRVLLISLDEQTVRQVQIALSLEQMESVIAENAEQALEWIDQNVVDILIISDYPHGLTIENFLIKIRAFSSRSPIIVLMDKQDAKRRVRFYRLGASDIIHTPFHSEELVVRIENILRLTGKDWRIPLRVDDVLIEQASKTVYVEGEAVPLTPTEFDLLLYLVRNEGTVLDRDLILAEVWGYDFAGDTNLVDVYIRYLRQKIDKKFKKKLIHTVRGVGYRFAVE